MWLTIPKAAKYAVMRRERFEQLVGRGIIPAYVEHGRRLVKSDDVDAYIESQPKAATAPAYARAVD